MDILLIEDNDYRRVTILKYLLRCGHRATPRSSVSEAEEILQFVAPGDNPGDVVIVAEELMNEGGAGLKRALSMRLTRLAGSCFRPTAALPGWPRGSPIRPTTTWPTARPIRASTS